MLRRSVLRATVLALAMSATALAATSRDQQRCLNTVNEAATAVGRAVAATTVGCVRALARGKAGDDTIAACITADRQGRIAKAQGKTSAAVDHCRDLPAFGGTDADVVNAAFAGVFDPAVFFGSE